MNEKQREEVALAKFQVIAPILNKDFPDASQQAYYERLSQEPLKRVDGSEWRVKPGGIRDWVYLYRKYGFDGLKPKVRTETSTKRLTDDQKQRLIALKEERPRRTVTNLYHYLSENGELNPQTVSLSTVQRFMRQQNEQYRWRSPEDRRSFEMAHANDMWQIDTSYGPYLYDEKGKNPKRLYIIAAIDDASRLIVGQGLFLEDTAIHVQEVLKQAMKRYGLPKKIFVDNGSPYKNKQLALILAQLGIDLIHARVRSGASKAKIERTFRTLKDDWMPAIDYKEFESLTAFNDSLTDYIRQKNIKDHRSLGQSPWQRFREDQMHIRRKSEEAIEQAFLHTKEYRVDKTGIVKLKGKEIEVGYAYIGQRVTLKYTADLSRFYLYEKDQLHPVEPVDKISNSQIKRKQYRMTEGGIK